MTAFSDATCAAYNKEVFKWTEGLHEKIMNSYKYKNIVPNAVIEGLIPG